MTTIDKIKTKYGGVAGISLTVTSDSITARLPVANGFPVALFLNKNEYIVRYDGWHEHFHSEQEALAAFDFGLSAKCRLVVHSRGNFRYRWVVEYLENGQWREDSHTAMLFFPFWMKKQILILQNK